MGTMKANVELARRLRIRFAQLCARRGHNRVTIRHVYAHAKRAGNEAADRLAKAGASGAASGATAEVFRIAAAAHSEFQQHQRHDQEDISRVRDTG